MSDSIEHHSNGDDSETRKPGESVAPDAQGPDLIGLLLGALDPDAHAAAEAEIARRPEMREQLAALRRAVQLLKDQPPIDPPAGLASRTCAAIFADREAEPEAATSQSASVELSASRSARESAARGRRRRLAMGGQEPLAVVGRGWRAADLVVAIGVCVAIVAMVFPLVHASRARSQITACANKLREIGLALTGYSERRGGLFPEVEESGNLSMAGVYAPTLVDSGFLEDPRIVICPSSKLADGPSFRVPTLDEVRKASPQRLRELRPTMGGSYGYAFGYRDNGKYKPTRNRYRDTFALAADMPADDLGSSPNHGRSGQNVLLEDGHVVYLCTRRLEGSGDDIFQNDLGQVAAGCHADDSVVARSDASP